MRPLPARTGNDTQRSATRSTTPAWLAGAGLQQAAAAGPGKAPYEPHHSVPRRRELVFSQFWRPAIGGSLALVGRTYRKVDLHAARGERCASGGQCAHVHATGSPWWDGSGGIRAPESSVGGERPEFPDSCRLPSTAATTMAAPGRTKGGPATERRPRYALVKRRLSPSPAAGSASLDRMSFAGARHDDCIMAFFCCGGPRSWCAYRFFSARASTIGAREERATQGPAGDVATVSYHWHSFTFALEKEFSPRGPSG